MARKSLFHLLGIVKSDTCEDRAFQSNSDPFVFSVHDITKLYGSSTRLAKKE
jgi:hypothetical protein